MISGLLQRVKLTTLVVGAAGSLGLLLREGRNTPGVLLVLFVGWVMSPFLVLAWANIVSTRWSMLTQALLYLVTLSVTLGSLACYGHVIRPPAGSARGFVWVAVPPASLLLIGIVPIALSIVRRRARQEKPE